MKQALRLDLLGYAAGRETPPRPMGVYHHHQEIELNFVFAGGVTYLRGGAAWRLGAGRLAVFWGATPHSLVTVEPGTDFGWITLPLAAVRGWAPGARFLGALLGGAVQLAPEGGAERFPVAAWIEELRGTQGAAPRGLTLELQGCLCWMAEHATTRARRAEAETGLGPVEAMARVMAERYQEPLDVARIAKAAGLHPNYAMNLFKRRCGLTIRDYLAQLRLTHAQRRLLEGDAKITEVALESGFATLSAFYEAFTRRVGMTPRAYRARFAGVAEADK